MTYEDALLSLEGLSLGDAFGEMFFSTPARRIVQKELPPPPWNWTDDTHMALSIVEVLRDHGSIDQDALAQAFARRYEQEPWRGYGAGAKRLLFQITRGGDWRQLAPKLFGVGSFGNGAAMRAAPIGGFFAGDPDRASREARLSAQVTHAHPEGQAGAMAVAAAAAIAAGQQLTPGVHFLERVLAYLPHGPTRDGIQHSLEIPAHDITRATRTLGTGDMISAQDTVPFCLWCASNHLNDYVNALWTTVAGLGDRDTTCAVVGGVVALSSRSLPPEWLLHREPLPEGFAY